MLYYNLCTKFANFKAKEFYILSGQHMNKDQQFDLDL